LLATQQPKAPVHVFARDRGLDALHPHEVLLVEGPQALEARLEVLEELVEFVGSHGGGGAPRMLAPTSSAIRGRGPREGLLARALRSWAHASPPRAPLLRRGIAPLGRSVRGAARAGGRVAPARS